MLTSLTVGYLLYKHAPFNEFQVYKINIDYKKIPLPVIVLNFFTYLPKDQNFSIYLNKFFHNSHLTKSSFTCPGLWASVLVRILHMLLKAKNGNDYFQNSRS